MRTPARGAGRRWSRRVLTLAVVLALTAAVPPSQASEVPVGAHALSLGMPPALLDDPTLIFQFPQEAVRWDAFLLALPQKSSSPAGVGGLLRPGNQAVFLLGQPENTFTGGTMLQLGWARRMGALRVGAAARGARSYSKQRQVYDTEQRERRLQQDLMEGAVGVGWGDKEGRIDAALKVGVPHELNHVASPEGSSRTEIVRRPFFTGHVRTELPLGERSHWVASISAGKGTRLWDWETTRSQTVRRDPQLLGVRTALSVGSAAVEEVLVFASFESTRNPSRVGFYGDGGRSVFWDIDRRATLGIAVRQDLGRGFQALAGARESYIWQRNEGAYYEPPDAPPTYTSTSTDEIADERFSWGIARSWRRFHFLGAADLTLDIEDLFLALDVRVDL